MSYRFEMGFRHVRSELEMFRICTQFSKTMVSVKYAPEIIRYSFLPEFKFQKDVLKNQVDLDSALKAAFQTRFVYWPQHRLLGLPTNSWPEELCDNFHFTSPIVFQNGTDQDYPLETWDDRISVFKEIKLAVSQLTDDEALRELGFCKANEQPPYPYVRKSCVYRRIFKGLELERWLEGEDSERFVRYSFSGIDTTELLFALNTCVKRLERDKRRALTGKRRPV